MSSEARPPSGRIAGLSIRLVLWLIAAAAVSLLALRVLIPSADALSFGFASYYTSARLVLAGELDPRIYDDAWFQEQERQLGLRDDIYGHQPPTMALVMLPVAWLPAGPARAAWLLIDVACLVLLGLLATRSAATIGARAGAATAAAMVVVVALYPPLWAELRYAQVHTLLALWYALWLYGLVTRRDWLCGAALALLALAKLAGAPLWLLLLVLGRWRALAWAAGLTAAWLVATLPLVGLDTWQAYLFGRVGDLAANPIFGVTALQTVASLLRQLFVYDPTYTPAPLLDAPVLATGLWLAAAAGLLGLTLASARRFPPLVAGAATLCLVVPTQPAGEQHHYVMLLTPLLLALILAAHHLRGAARDPRTLRTWPRRVMAPEARAVSAGLALAAAALMLLPSNYFLDNAAWAGWPRAIFAYPRLYGALLLWAAWMFYGSDRGGRLRA